VLAAKTLPEHVPGTTVDRQCGSAQQAVHFAVQAVLSGTMDIVIAGGVESMSGIPIGASIMDGMKAGHGNPFTSEGIAAKYPGKMFSQFAGAELLAKKYGITREEMDKFGVESHKRAHAAQKGGHFDREIAPIKGQDKEGKDVVVKQDEGVRPETTYEKLSKLALLQSDGVVTAGTASQISDGAAAVLIVNSAGLKKLGLKPRARFVAISVCGSCPEIMLEGPIPATTKVLQTAGMKIGDIDVYEVNEAFGSVPLAWAKAVGADLNKLNVNGGAIALGHPLGCTGAKLLTTMVHELERRNARYGLQAICEGGGTANALIIERVGAGAAKL
jgi:acetyl-CoA acetyltransferase family protein